MEAAKLAESYEDDVTRTAASVIECIYTAGRVDLVQLIQLAQQKPTAWFDDMVCVLESSGNVARVVVDGLEGWVLAEIGEEPSQDVRIPPLRLLFASILPKREAIHCRHALAAHVDIFANADPALQVWWRESDKESCVGELEQNLHTLNLLLETSSPQSYVWSKESSQNQWMLGIGPVFPCEDDLVEYLAQDPLRLHAATTYDKFSCLLQTFRLSRALSSSFRQWWISLVEAPTTVIIIRQFRRRGILQLHSNPDVFQWKILALIKQAFKIQSPEAERSSKSMWTLERVTMLRESAKDAFTAQAVKYTPNQCNFQVAAAETNAITLPTTTTTSIHTVLHGILDNMIRKTELVKDRTCNTSSHRVDKVILDLPRNEMKTNSDSNVGLIPDNLKRHVQNAEAIVSIVLNRFWYFPLSKMTKWITKLIKKQCLNISPNDFLNLVVAVVKPFAIVVPNFPVMFVKQAESKSRSRFLADTDAKQWAKQYIKKVEKKIKKARSKLQNAKKSYPFHAELADDIADAKSIVDYLNRNVHHINDSVVIQAPDSLESLSTSHDGKDIHDNIPACPTEREY
ncbi:hypothetical protein Ae201684P_001041 [Aphanomyces euteiches]|nr:hypothetical protein Ae201684P_001041 [Aphanomyces euteiches]